MITQDNFVFSKSAAARILGIPAPKIKEVREYANAAWVHVRGCSPFFLSKSLFWQEFHDRRKAAARALIVTPHLLNSGFYTVRNESKGTTYTVSAAKQVLWCECEDYRNQEKYLDSLPTCKHVHAVIAYLGSRKLEPVIAS